MTFYRLHRSEVPEFSADNAWSAPWGETFLAEGAQYECRACNGSGEFLGDRCPDCDGNGVLDADRGYSCFDSAAELLAYFGQHYPAEVGDPVVVFEGVYVGTGFDGELLAIPTKVVRWTTFGELREERS